EVLNQLILLMPRYKELIEMSKERFLFHIEKAVQRDNHRERALYEENSKYLLMMYEAYFKDYIQWNLNRLRNVFLVHLNSFNHQRADQIHENEFEHEIVQNSETQMEHEFVQNSETRMEHEFVQNS